MKAQEFLQKGNPAVRVALVTGEEGWFRERVGDMIAAGCDDVEIVTGPGTRDAAGFDLGNFLEGMRTGSLFGGERLVRVRPADGLVKTHADALIELLRSGEMAHRLVLEGESLVPKSGKGAVGAKARAAPGNALAEAVEAVGGVVVRCDTLYDKPPPWGGSVLDTELVGWIVAEAKRRGKAMRRETAHLLQERAGSDLRTLAAHLEKLALYVAEAPGISDQAVDACVGAARSAPAFDLAEAVASADVRAAFAVSASLFDMGVEEPGGRRNTDPQGIAILCAAAISRKVRQVLHACDLMDAGVPIEQAAESAGVYRTFFPGFRPQVETWRSRPRARLLDDVVALDRALKSGGGPPRVLLETFIAEALGVASGKAARR